MSGLTHWHQWHIVPNLELVYSIWTLLIVSKSLPSSRTAGLAIHTSVVVIYWPCPAISVQFQKGAGLIVPRQRLITEFCVVSVTGICLHFMKMSGFDADKWDSQQVCCNLRRLISIQKDVFCMRTPAWVHCFGSNLTNKYMQWNA